MNYKILLNIVDSIIWHFKCPDCSSSIDKDDLEILWTSWWSLNAEVICKKCSRHTYIKAELNKFPVFNNWLINKEQVEIIKNKIEQEKSKNKIDDEQILSLRETLLKNENLSVWDIFK